MSNEVKIAITSKADLAAIDRAIAKLKELRNKTVKVKFDIDDDNLTKKLKDLDKKVKKAGGIELDIDDRKAHKKLDGLIDKHKQLGKDHAEIDLDTKKARNKLTYLLGRIDSLADETVNIDIDQGGALGKIAALKAALKAIPDEEVNVNVNVNSKGLKLPKGDIQKLRRDIDNSLRIPDAAKFRVRDDIDDALRLPNGQSSSLRRDLDKAMNIPDSAKFRVRRQIDDSLRLSPGASSKLNKDIQRALKLTNGPSVRIKAHERYEKMAAALREVGNAAEDLDNTDVDIRVKTTDADSSAKSIKKVGKAAKETAKDVDDLDTSTKRHVSTAVSMKGATSRLRSAVSDLGRDYARTSRDGNAVTRTMRGFRGSAGSALRTMGAVGNVMTQSFALMSRGIPVLGGMIRGLNQLSSAAMSAGTEGVGALASFGKVAGPIGAVAIAAGLATVALGAVSAIGVAGTGALVAGMYATQAALGGIVGVSSVVGAAVGAAIAAPFVYFAAQTKEVQDAMDGMTTYIGTAMKDISSETVGPALIGFTNRAKEAFDSVRPSIQRMGEATGKLVTQLSDKLPAVAQALAPALEKGLAAGSKHLNQMVDALPGISKGLGNLFDSLGSPEVMAASERFWNAVPGMITGAGKAVEGAAVAFTKVSDWMGSDQLAPMRDGLAAFAQEMGATDWSPAINGARDAMNAFGDFVGSIDGADVAGIVEGITGAFEGLTNIATEIDLVGMINGLVQGIDGAIAGLGTTVKAVKIAISPSFEIVGGGVEGLMNQIKGITSPGGNLDLGASNPFSPSTQIKILANVIWELVDDPVSQLGTKIAEIVQTIAAGPGGGEGTNIPMTATIDPEFVLANTGSAEEARNQIAAMLRSLEGKGYDVSIPITPKLILTELLSPGTQILPPVNVDVEGNLTDIIMPNLGLEPVKLPPTTVDVKPVIGPITGMVGDSLAGVTAPTIPIKGVLQSFDGAQITPPEIPVKANVIADLNLSALAGGAAPTIPIKGVMSGLDLTGAQVDTKVPVQGTLSSIITGSLGGANVPEVQVNGRLGEIQGTAAPVEVPTIPIFNAEGLKVGEIEVPTRLGAPSNTVPTPPPVQVPYTFGGNAPGAAPTYNGPPVEIPTVLGPTLGLNKPPPLPPITQPVVPKFEGLMGATPTLPPAELPVHAKMDTSGVPTTLPPATQEVIQIKSGFNKEMATKLPPITQEVIPQVRAMPPIPPLTVQVIPQFAGAAIPNLPPITVPVNFQVGPLNLPQPPTITVTVTSNASEVASQVSSIPTSVTTSHTVNTNVGAAISQIQALNGMNTTSTHTVNVVVNGSIPGGGGGGAPAAFAGIPQGISPMAGVAGFGAMSDTGLTGVAQAGGMTSDFRYSNGSGGSLLAISNIVKRSIVDGYSDLGSSIGDALVDGIQSKESLISGALNDMSALITDSFGVNLDLGSMLDGLLGNLGIFDTLGNNIGKKIVGSAGSTLAREAEASGGLFGMFNLKIAGLEGWQNLLANLFSGIGVVRAPRRLASGSLDGTGQMIVYNNYQTIQNQFDGGLVGDPERQAKRVLDVLETVGAGRRANQILGNGATTGGTA